MAPNKYVFKDEDFADLLKPQATFSDQDFADMTHDHRGVIQGQGTETKLAESLGQSGFKGKGLDDAGTRAKMGWANDSDAASKEASFKRAYPQGEFKRTEMGDLFRVSPDQEWDYVDGGGLSTFEPINDIADLSGMAGALAGETAAAFATRGRNLPKIVGPLALAGGAAAGELTRQFTDRDSTTDYGERGMQAIKEGAFAGGFGFVGGTLGRKFNGEGVLNVNPEDREIIQFTKDKQWLKDLMPFQAASHPTARSFGKQAETYSRSVKEYGREQNKSAVEFGRSLGDPANLDPNIMSVLQDGIRARKDQITSMLTVPPTTWEQAGKEVVKLVNKYAEETKANVDWFYEKAKAAGPVAFDLTNVKALTKDMTGSAIPVANPTKEKTHEVFGAPSAELKAIIGKLDNINPLLKDTVDANGKTITAMQQLIDIRAELFELTMPNIAGGKKPDLMARKLYGELNDAMEKPIAGNKRAIEAWKEAQGLARERFGDLESYQAMQLFRTGTKESGLTSAEVAQMLVRPGKGEFLEEVQKMSDMVGDGSFEKLQDAFKSSLLTGAKSGQDIIAKLDEWRDDPHTLARFLSPSEIQTFRQMGNDLNRLQSSGLQETIDRYTKAGADLLTMKGSMKGIFQSADPRMVDEMNKAFGTPGSPEHLKLKAGLMNHIIESSLIDKEGIKAIDPKKLRSILENARESGAADYIDDEDVDSLFKLARYSEIVNRSADTGSSMVGGQMTSSMNPFHTPIQKVAETIWSLAAANRFYGYLVLSKPMRRFWIGDGSTPGRVPGWELTGAVVGSVVSELTGDTVRAFSE